MPVFLTLVSLILLLTSQAPAQSSCAIHVASFNIHYIVPYDKNESWKERRTAVTSVLKEIDADIIAFQEMETFEGGNYSHRNLQLDWINTTTPGYENAATGDPKLFPGTQPILYKQAKFMAVDQGFFFFSDTPDLIYSRQWNGGYPYFCSWAKFRSSCNDQDFYVFNIYNDYKSRKNRLKSSALISDRIKTIVPEKVPMVVLGDFNAWKRSKEIGLLEAAGLSVVQPGGATFRRWGFHLGPAIDHVIISKEFKPLSGIKVWKDRYDGVFPSDHNPISVKLLFLDTAKID